MRSINQNSKFLNDLTASCILHDVRINVYPDKYDGLIQRVHVCRGPWRRPDIIIPFWREVFTDWKARRVDVCQMYFHLNLGYGFYLRDIRYLDLASYNGEPSFRVLMSEKDYKDYQAIKYPSLKRKMVVMEGLLGKVIYVPIRKVFQIGIHGTF